MATRMQQRRSPSSEWTAANPILAAGEIGFETDTNKFKFGDGVNHWADLTFFSSAEELQNIIDGAPDLLNTLNELAASLGDDPEFFTTVATNLSSHESDTTNIHGIADTAALATKTYADSAVSTAVSGLSKSSVGLGNVDNTSDANKPVSTATQTALDAKASNSALTNHESDTTNIHGIVDTSLLATKSYADTAASNAAAAIVDSAPSALNTLNELAAALGDDANYAATITTALGEKASQSYVDGLTTADIAEDTNLYFTDQRAVDAIVYAINNGLDVTLDGGTL